MSELQYNRLQGYGLSHIRALMTSLGYLFRSRWSSLLTIGVIAIALALPLGLLVLLNNAQQVSGSINATGKMSLYLKSSTNNHQGEQLAHKLRQQSQVANADYISPQQGLKAFSQAAQMGNILNHLPNNPIPGVVTVQPQPNLNASQVQQLVTKLSHLDPVEHAQLDMKWLQRLQAILNIAHRLAMILGVLFAIAVLLIIGNTLRLTIQHHREEMMIIRLLGGTRRFIRLPFLYSGVLYGFSGGFVAWLLINITILLLQGPISQLAQLYDTHYNLNGLGLGSLLQLLLLSAFLGWLSAWLTVTRFIRSLENKNAR